MQHKQKASTTRQYADSMFRFVGGPRFGPLAVSSTPSKLHAYDEMDDGDGERWVSPATREAAAHVRRWYHAEEKPPLRWYNRTEHCSHVALHVRLGDVSGDPNSTNYVRWTPQEAIDSCVRAALARMSRRCGRARLHVFSERGHGHGEADLAYLRRYRPAFHISEDVQDTFHHMVEADALIIARSSLSQVAAYLSRSSHVFAPFNPFAQFGANRMLFARTFAERLEQCGEVQAGG